LNVDDTNKKFSSKCIDVRENLRILALLHAFSFNAIGTQELKIIFKNVKAFKINSLTQIFIFKCGS